MQGLLGNPLLNMGLGILSANRPGVGFAQAVGQGGLLGMDAMRKNQLIELERQKVEAANRRTGLLGQKTQYEIEKAQREAQEKAKIEEARAILAQKHPDKAQLIATAPAELITEWIQQEIGVRDYNLRPIKVLRRGGSVADAQLDPRSGQIIMNDGSMYDPSGDQLMGLPQSAGEETIGFWERGLRQGQAPAQQAPAEYPVTSDDDLVPVEIGGVTQWLPAKDLGGPVPQPADTTERGAELMGKAGGFGANVQRGINAITGQFGGEATYPEAEEAANAAEQMRALGVSYFGDAQGRVPVWFQQLVNKFQVGTGLWDVASRNKTRYKGYKRALEGRARAREEFANRSRAEVSPAKRREALDEADKIRQYLREIEIVFEETPEASSVDETPKTKAERLNRIKDKWREDNPTGTATEFRKYLKSIGEL